MKKLFIAALALVSLAACSKSEVIGEVEKEAITFGNNFINNSTKAIDPSETVSTLEAFKVYGTISKDNAIANIFAGVDVSKNTSTNYGNANSGIQWGYAANSTQYWIPDNTYKFEAIANATTIATDNKTKMPTTISFTNTDGKSDLLYAVNDFGVFGTEQGQNPETCVGFTFKHLLSKVKFTFVNGYPNDSKLKVKVTGVKIINALNSGVYTIDGATWAAADGSANNVTLDFGNIVAGNTTAEGSNAGEIDATGSGTDASWATGAGLSSNYERLLIPGNKQSLNITFTAEVYYENVLVNTIAKTAAAPSTVIADFTAGNSYNITGVIGGKLDVITFTVTEISDWKTGENPNNIN